MNTDKRLIPVGQASSEGSQGGMVYSISGLAQTICACTHGYAIGNILVKKASRGMAMELNNITVNDVVTLFVNSNPTGLVMIVELSEDGESIKKTFYEGDPRLTPFVLLKRKLVSLRAYSGNIELDVEHLD